MALIFNDKLQNAIEFSSIAFNKINSDKELTMLKAREAIEAICKAILLKVLPSGVGEAKIKPDPTKGEIQLDKLISEVNQGIIIPDSNERKTNIKRIELIQVNTNQALHDSNSRKNILKEDVEITLTALKLTIRWFFNNFLRNSIPDELERALNNFNSSITNDIIELPIWEGFHSYCNFFKRQDNNYVLITPPDLIVPNYKCNQSQLAAFDRLPFDLIFDFNFDTRENGIASTIDLSTEYYNFLHIDIKPEITKYGEAKYWFGANGLKGVQNSKECENFDLKDSKTWKRKYNEYLRNLLQQFAKHFKFKETTIVIFWSNLQFVEIIVDLFEEIFDYNLIKYAIIINNEDEVDAIKELFTAYNGTYEIFNSSISQIAEGIKRYFPLTAIDNNRYALPAIKSIGELQIDLRTYKHLRNQGIELIYKDIDIRETEIDNLDFYKGKRAITWKEIRLDKNVKRTIINDDFSNDSFSQKVFELLKNEESTRIDLIHYPGAGGTTAARYIAYRTHSFYPTLFIDNYEKNETLLHLTEIFDKTQLPVLAIVENKSIKDIDLDMLIREIKRAGKIIIFLYVKSTFNAKEQTKQYLSDFLDERENQAFYDKYLPLSNNKSGLTEIKEKKTPTERNPFVYGLTAFEKDFKGIESYVKSRIEELKKENNQIVEFLGLLSLYSYYTRKPIATQIFASVFNEKRFLIKSAFKKNSPIYDLIKLSEYSLIINRPESIEIRHPLISEEILKNLYLENTGEEWKSNLSKWAIKFIKLCIQENGIIPDDIEDALIALITEREGQSFHGKDTGELQGKYQQFEKFSKLISDINDVEKGQEVFEELVRAFPDNAHFKAHLGRFYYEIQKETGYDKQRFEKAENVLLEALNIANGDFNIHQMYGMNFLRWIERILANYNKLERESGFQEYEIEAQQYADKALDAFETSISIEVDNLHAYTAALSTIEKIIKIGRKNYHFDNKEFFTYSKNNYYEEKLNQYINLLERVKQIVTLRTNLEVQAVDNNLTLNSYYGKLSNMIGSYKVAAKHFNKASDDVTDSKTKARYKLYSVISTLNSYSENLVDSWKSLNASEIKEIRELLKQNMDLDITNTYNLKLWLQSIRYSTENIDLNTCISAIKEWKKYGNELFKLEATYYLYILYTLQVIEMNGQADSIDIDRIKNLIKECRENRIILNSNDKYIFEWYGSTGDGLKRLVSQHELSSLEVTKKDQLKGVLKGRIVEIKVSESTTGFSRQGTIRLECGLDAFFNPSHGRFRKGVDDVAQTKVNFHLGFRYDGLQAIDVNPFVNEPNTIDIQTEKEVENGKGGNKKVESIKYLKGKIDELHDNYGFIKSQKLDKRIYFNQNHIEGGAIMFRILDFNSEVEFLCKEKDNTLEIFRNAYQASIVRLC